MSYRWHGGWKRRGVAVRDGMVCERSVGEKDGEKTTSSWGLVCHFAKTAILLLAWLASVYILRRLRGW